MKRTPFRALLCALLASLALTTLALADSGPKPQLTVRVKNAPQEPYYLDLLAEGEWDAAADAASFDGIDWSYSDEEAAALDQELLALLRASVPEGWHACTAEGSLNAPMYGDLYAESTDALGDPLHVFGYHGVPSVYRIIIVTESGEVWISDTLERKVLQCSATVDWADGTAEAEETTVTTPPVFVGYALQFLATLVPTLVIEGVLLLLFGYSWKRNWRAFLFVNLVTQGLLALASSLLTIGNGASFWNYFFFLIPAELAVLLLELYLYAGRGLLKGRSRSRAAAYAAAANLSSALLGYFLAVPVWQFVVSIS